MFLTFRIFMLSGAGDAYSRTRNWKALGGTWELGGLGPL